MKDVLLGLLSKELKLPDDSTGILKYSYGNCQKIGIQKDYVIEDMDQYLLDSTERIRAYSKKRYFSLGKGCKGNI